MCWLYWYHLCLSFFFHFFAHTCIQTVMSSNVCTYKCMFSTKTLECQWNPVYYGQIDFWGSLCRLLPLWYVFNVFKFYFHLLPFPPSKLYLFNFIFWTLKVFNKKQENLKLFGIDYYAWGGFLYFAINILKNILVHIYNFYKCVDEFTNIISNCLEF